MSWMTLADFEARYQADPDPWRYTASQYERDKYAATLEACGPGPFRRALELGSSIGVFSAMLAPLCERVVTIDGAATAVQSARKRLAACRSVDVRLGEIPDALPDGPFDLVVASEILYYLAPEQLERTLRAVVDRMPAGSRLVAVHWRAPGPERPYDADGAHGVLRATPGLEPIETGGNADYLLDVLERR